SEKCQLRAWDRDDHASLAPLLRQLHRIRRAHPALRQNAGLVFHQVDDDALICFSQRYDNDVLLVAACLDPSAPRRARLSLRLDALGLAGDTPFCCDELLTGAQRHWQGAEQELALDPSAGPAAIYHVTPLRDRT